MRLCRASTGAQPRPNPSGAALLPVRATPPTTADSALSPIPRRTASSREIALRRLPSLRALPRPIVMPSASSVITSSIMGHHCQ